MFSCQLGGEQDLQLQPAEQFIERQLNADKKFTEIRVLRADRIKTHFVDDFLNLQSVARKRRHTPFSVVESSPSGNALFYFAVTFALNLGLAAHQFEHFDERQ